MVIFLEIRFFWGSGWDSNMGPLDYQSETLPVHWSTWKEASQAKILGKSMQYSDGHDALSAMAQ